VIPPTKSGQTSAAGHRGGTLQEAYHEPGTTTT
jgi:hypothetical protein